MISNQQIVEIAKHALAKVFKTWLDENKAEIVKIVAASIPVPAKLQRQAEPAPKPSPTPALAPEEYLTPQELAKRWNLCVASVYRRLRRDEIPLMRISQRHILVPIAAVKKYEALATYPKLR